MFFPASSSLRQCSGCWSPLSDFQVPALIRNLRPRHSKKMNGVLKNIVCKLRLDLFIQLQVALCFLQQNFFLLSAQVHIKSVISSSLLGNCGCSPWIWKHAAICLTKNILSIPVCQCIWTSQILLQNADGIRCRCCAMVLHFKFPIWRVLHWHPEVLWQQTFCPDTKKQKNRKQNKKWLLFD